MGKNKAPEQPPVPQAPKPENQFFMKNGQVQSSTVKYKAGDSPTGQAGWVTNVTQTPQEKAIEAQSNQFISDLIPKVNGIMGQDLSTYKQNFMAPQLAQLEEGYNRATGRAKDAAGARGTNISTGFEKYRTNQIDKNYAQGRADIAANAELSAPEYMRSLLAPYADGLNMYSAALGGQQAQTFNSADASLRGSQLGNSINSNAFGNQLNQYNASLAGQPPPRQRIFGIF
jgi:hypothetical protein